MKILVTAMAMLLVFELAPTAQLAFDVASIKEDKSLAEGGTMRPMPGGGITANHFPPRALVAIAYDLKNFQVVNLPDWASNTYYNLIAKPSEASTRAQTSVMFQALLVDRFKLAFHRETREVDGYSLVQAKPGTLGPTLHPSTIDCEKAFDSTPRCKEGGITFDRGELAMKENGTKISNLLNVIIGAVGAPVSDDTALPGPFDFDLRFSNDVASTGDVPSIFTALQEQLGLKLERRHVSTEVFVVDRFEHPTPD